MGHSVARASWVFPSEWSSRSPAVGRPPERATATARQALGLARQLRRPLPDVVVMRSTVLWRTLDEEPGDPLEHLVPDVGVAAHHAGRRARRERPQQLAEQVFDDPGVGRLAD